jgi:hypothetical protein
LRGEQHKTPPPHAHRGDPVRVFTQTRNHPWP